MDRRYLAGALLALVAIVVSSFVLTTFWFAPSDPLDTGQTYPPGAGPDHINFSALDNNSANVSHTPREYWESYAILYTAPPERRLVEGDYYINSSTGEIIAERWHNATIYRNGTDYAFLQPAEGISERRREQFESDPAFVYHDQTDSYYRFDPHYGTIAPTNIGRHTMILDSYTWEAINTTTHYGVPVITYGVTGTQSDSQVPPAIDGTLRLGLQDGIIYGYNITLDADQQTYHYTYSVRPAPFPEHDWVNTARELANNSTNGSSE